nr:Ash family protein [Escherichia coli]
STKSSRANFLAFVCDAFDSSSHVFPRLILFSIKREAAFLFSDESMGLLPVCCSTMASMSSWCCSCRKNFSSSGGKSILISCTAERRSTSHHGADGCYSFYGVKEAKADRYRFLGEINRRGYLSRNASSANRFGLVRGEGLSKDSRSRRTFSRWRSSMDNAISCNSSFVIVCTRKAVRCSTSYHSAGIFYGCNLRDDSGRFATYCININNVMLLCAFKENAGIFRTNFSRNTSDHLSKKAAYTEAIPYKTGIGITTPQELEAIHDAPASFFVSAHTHTSTMVGCMGPTSVGLVSSNASCGNPVQSTASELTTSGGGYNPKV